MIPLKRKIAIDNKSNKAEIVVALAGNPNVGKSSIFNALTGMHQHTGNWAGKTVDTAYGRCESRKHAYKIIDLPGAYSLNAHSAEETITRDEIIKGNAKITAIVCDATCLERNLIFALQCIEASESTLIILNMIDEAQKRGINIDIHALEEEVKTTVITVCAKDRSCKEKILSALDKLTSQPTAHKKQITDSKTKVKEAKQIYDKVVSYKEKYSKRDHAIDRILTSRTLGFPIMILFMLLLFWITIVGANYPSALLSRLFGYIGSHLNTILDIINTPKLLSGIIIDGIYKVLSWVIAVMLPPMAIFFPLFTILEDLGYLPRIAYNLDKPFQRCKSCGKQSLTMCMGIGCNAVGVTGARIIDSDRERILSILTNNFIPCNGRFPAIISVITMFFVVSSNSLVGGLLSSAILCSFLLLSVIITMLVTLILSKTLLKGRSSSCTLELPPYRRPQFTKTIIRSIFERTIYVLLRAVYISAPAGLVIYLLANINIENSSILHYLSQILEPLGNIMGLDGVILLAFILGMPANEIVLPIALMMYLSNTTLLEIDNVTMIKDILLSNGWNLLTAINFIILSIFHFPCSTTLITIYKETKNVKWTLVSFLLPTIIGIILCIISSFIYNVFT